MHNEPRCIQATAGLCFAFAKRSVIYADTRYELTSAWPSRALSHVAITLSAVAFRPGRHSWLSRHRDPAPVGVSHTVPVESSLLHCIGIDALSKEGTFRFRPKSWEQRRKHRNVPLLPRRCQLFSLYFAATLSPWSVIHSDRIRWDSQVARCALCRQF